MSVTSIDSMIDHLLRLEGGYVNDPDDPGGPTNFGVTQATLASWRGHPVSADDVRAMDISEARDIYKRRYFVRPKIDQLPDALQPSVFDMNVNAGGNSIKILQRTLREFGKDVSVDGALGPQSIGAAIDAYNEAGDYLVDAYGIERRNFYYRLADRRASSRKYARRKDGGKGGWIKRAEEFMREQYRLTDSQHAERVRAWA